MLKIDNLIYSYDGEKNILDGTSFKIEKGRVYCLLGGNGAGKTTLFRCMTGFFQCNIDIDTDTINEKIIYIHDQMYFYRNLTGEEFINLIVSLKNRKINREKYNKLLEQLKMKEYIEYCISTYSLGTKQKLVMIIAFLLEYEYIFMDEPFASLDFIAAEVIMNSMREYVKKDYSVVISTHLIDIAHEIADTILFLNEGKVYEIENDFTSAREIKERIRELI
jgi:ABC-2 type transport system ATP-binding protein